MDREVGGERDEERERGKRRRRRERETWKREGGEINRTERGVDEWEGERDG